MISQEEQVQSKADKAEAVARAYYREGLNCAECVFLSFLDTHETDLPREVLRLASGFGGGIGHTKNICGAITGAILGLGTQKGRDPFEKDEVKERAQELRQEVYPRFAALLQEIEAHYGTLLCSELTAQHADFDAPTRKKSCQEIIGTCARIAALHAERP